MTKMNSRKSDEKKEGLEINNACLPPAPAYAPARQHHVQPVKARQRGELEADGGPAEPQRDVARVVKPTATTGTCMSRKRRHYGRSDTCPCHDQFFNHPEIPPSQLW